MAAPRPRRPSSARSPLLDKQGQRPHLRSALPPKTAPRTRPLAAEHKYLNSKIRTVSKVYCPQQDGRRKSRFKGNSVAWVGAARRVRKEAPKQRTRTRATGGAGAHAPPSDRTARPAAGGLRPAGPASPGRYAGRRDAAAGEVHPELAQRQSLRSRPAGQLAGPRGGRGGPRRIPEQGGTAWAPGPEVPAGPASHPRLCVGSPRESETQPGTFPPHTGQPDSLAAATGPSSPGRRGPAPASTAAEVRAGLRRRRRSESRRRRGTWMRNTSPAPARPTPGRAAKGSGGHGRQRRPRAPPAGAGVPGPPHVRRTRGPRRPPPLSVCGAPARAAGSRAGPGGPGHTLDRRPRAAARADPEGPRVPVWQPRGPTAGAGAAGGAAGTGVSRGGRRPSPGPRVNRATARRGRPRAWGTDASPR